MNESDVPYSGIRVKVTERLTGRVLHGTIISLYAIEDQWRAVVDLDLDNPTAFDLDEVEPCTLLDELSEAVKE